ncbi:MAG: DNA mismatch repair protein MutS [Bradyrhizobiaceae bacterium]|nr:MAG: DNA mismatch repair protein MutS [Bradyrhizobiaceae bacterium]
MKRAAPPTPPLFVERKRALSEEERALWDSVAKSIKPLRKKTRAAKTEAIAVDDTAPVTSMKFEPVPSKAAPPAITKPVSKPSAPPLAPIGRRERAQLSKGRKEIDGRLDLHGMTQARAHRALLAFLHRASADGMTFVLVITGKGASGQGHERGVLRRQVPEWLALPEFRGLVVGFEEAHIGHGGAGALYVRVRRAR